MVGVVLCLSSFFCSVTFFLLSFFLGGGVRFFYVGVFSLFVFGLYSFWVGWVVSVFVPRPPLCPGVHDACGHDGGLSG